MREAHCAVPDRSASVQREESQSAKQEETCRICFVDYLVTVGSGLSFLCCLICCLEGDEGDRVRAQVLRRVLGHVSPNKDHGRGHRRHLRPSRVP